MAVVKYLRQVIIGTYGDRAAYANRDASDGIYFYCDTEAEIPSSDVQNGDTAYTVDSGRRWIRAGGAWEVRTTDSLANSIMLSDDTVLAVGDCSDGQYLKRNGTALEGATIAGGGDVVGPASATDNAIARFDGTGGKTLQNSAATVSDDGIISSATNSGANAVRVPLTNWLMQTGDYTLSSSGSEQKAFNQTTNGTLTLPTGVYEFECFLYLTTMSATSGNLAFDPVGAGTAVTDRWGQHCYGIDNNSPLNAGARGGSASVTQQTPASAVTAGTGSGMVATFMGIFRISTGGTIIPSVTLVTANAAVVKAGSWFKIRKIGESSETSVGAWT